MKQIIKRLGLLLLLLTAIFNAHADPVASINENFDASTDIPAGWFQKQVAGDKPWYVRNFNENNYISISGYNGTAPFDQWLLSPAIDMDKVSDKTLTFDTQVNGYGATTTTFKVYIVTDPTNLATATELKATFATAPAAEADGKTKYSEWVKSGNVDLAKYKGKVYIAFRYQASKDANYATWCVDNVKLNAEGGVTPPTPPTTSGDGSENNPYNCAQVIAGVSGNAWVKGYIVGSSAGKTAAEMTNATGAAAATSNIFIAAKADETDYSKCVPVQLPTGEIRTALNINANPGNLGKVVAVKGSLEKYFGQPGVKTVTEFDLEGGVTPPTPPTTSGDGSENNPYTAAEVIAFNPQSSQEATKSAVWVTGYIVGWADVSAAPYAINAETAHFDASATMATNILVASSADVKDVSKCIGVQLPTGEIRSALNLQANPGNLGKSLQIKGDIMKYCGVPGIKNATAYKLEGGSTPTPTPTPSGDFKGDFNSFNNYQPLSKPYGTYTNNTGWTATNAIILGGGETDANPIFTFIGAAGTLAPTLNGKTAAPGSLVSPALTGSIKTLTFKYGFAFPESKCQFTVNVKDAAGNVIKSEVVTLDKIEKAKAYDFSLDVNYNGNFTIEIINNCYSQIADKNKDRVSIWNLTWTDINDKTFVYNNIQFEVFENSDSCYVIGGGSPELVIPASAINPKNNKTYKVTAIGSAAFKGTSLNSITIPEGVTSIWNDAFNECQSLTSVKMPKTLKYIGVRAFYSCSKLNNISLRNTKSCGNEAFSGCESLTVIDLEGMASIGQDAFRGCTGLIDVDLKNVSSLGKYAFRNCTGLKSVNMGNLSSINGTEFNGCKSIASIDFGKVTSIGANAFNGCTNLTDVNLKNVTTLGSSAFSGCTSLKSVDFGAITSLASYAFSGCTSLTSIDLKGTTSLGEYAFKNCTGLKSVNLGNVTTVNRSTFEDCKNIASIDFGKVASIGNSAFYGCASLTDINLKDVTSLGGSTFSNCTGLKDVVLGKVTSFGGYTFSGCTSLTNVDLGNTESIGDYTFSGCTSLKYLDLKKVVTVGEYAFDGCSGLISIDFGSVKTLGRQAFSNCSGLTSIDLKNVVEIGRAAFYGCTGLTSIDLKMVTTLGCYAFSGCTGLKSAKLGKVGTWMTNYDSAYSDDVNSAFLNCTNLETVDLGETSTLGNYLFRGCTALKDIDFKNVSELSNGAFYGCTGLTDLDLNKFAQLGTNTFMGCSGLKSLSILKASKLDASTFDGCSAIETLVLPYEWGTDFKMTLSGTTQLRTLYIGENTASIPNKTFVNNKNLFEVYSNAATPPSIGTATFGSETYSYATLYVPQGSVDAYKAATGWSKFEDIQELPFQIVVKDKKVSVDRTKSILVSASVTPASATSSDVKWYSLNDEIATTTTDGVVTGMAEGGVTLLAYCDGITSTMKVIVKKFDGVEDVMADDPTELSEFDVYNLQGIRVRANCTKEQLSELSHGIYILVSPQGRKKVII